jgi:RNA polymerase primary sigma factor
MEKETFLEHAWANYANNIYNLAKNYASNEIPLEDYFQQAYFALVKAYENYDPSFKGSFYNYFKRYLINDFNRYRQNQKNLIRIPVHRLEELEKFDKESETVLLIEGFVQINQTMEEDYTLYKTDYLSFEELYLNDSNLESIDDAIRSRIFSYFSKQSDYDPRYLSETPYLFIEPLDLEHSSFDQLLYEDKYNLWETDLLTNLWKFVDEKRKSIPFSAILRQRNGINKEGYEYTLEQIGDSFGVTRERVRQFEKMKL